MTSTQRLPIVVLISGRGSNLQAILDQSQTGQLPVEIRAVISNNAQAQGLERAHRAGIETQVLDHRHYPNRETFDRALMKIIDSYTPKLVVLAGFMRILTSEFVRHYQGHLINIHPSLLPNFPGLDTHRRVLLAGMREHGASVHFVTDKVDGGPIILQARIPVYPEDTAETLAARILREEHRIYPKAIRAFAEKKIRLEGEQIVWIKPLEA
ncbi:formyltetrahydrofolate-dependent phosphoribosylglycinamide formyltransferase [Nitrosococcus oceani ATCC 19707]|uniref:Phosphoribosylglycinamide formyltransferase n=2 Tax=Nitrosococcus oceani TaxID=1229 RepID=Q3JBW3_NITOC|nr:phosphoribosylglycinamide formyltransferase [Nitrosococcus oceani]ABA57683.1 formyltetrahydrofolate-dependent phosphoribosylglycinamide formyltransferase [Nitrosococcus oceani ATCC 19707]EDZ67590.1 phosphoribosylglycinamide formyltransferase [Nitrosococcus oceani AFC27]KFI19971.1 phosphoribosylglycinamide formyltransferase [Nitrosococcus oceani C-27]GEM19332.1 phosphoribosylglycinamide formyltransferase [Nitrosococcus oceani]